MRSKFPMFSLLCLLGLIWSLSLPGAESAAQLTLKCDRPGHLAKAGEVVNVTIHLSREGRPLADAPLLWLLEGHSSVYG